VATQRRAREAPLDFAVRSGHLDGRRAHSGETLAGPAAARHQADAGRRIRRERRTETEPILTGDQHEVRRVGANPAPERVGLGMVAIGLAARGKFERGAVGIDERNGENVDAANGTQPFERSDLPAHGGNRLVRAVETADQQHGRRVDVRRCNGDTFDDRATRAQAYVESLGRPSGKQIGATD
jgi:hypothetical protein